MEEVISKAKRLRVIEKSCAIPFGDGMVRSYGAEDFPLLVAPKHAESIPHKTRAYRTLTMISSKNCVNMLTVRPINSPKNSQNRPLRSKRLYGKRDANSARAALDIECKSSSRTHRNSENMSPEADNLVETLQEKLAGITLEEQSPKKLWTKKRPRIGVQIRQASPSADDKLEEENCKVSTNAAVTQNHDTEERHREAQAETPKPDETEKEQKGNKRKVIKSQPQARKSDLVNHYVRPILEEAMSTREVEDFDTWAERAGDMFDVEKIAEGSYGEVYQLRVRQDISRRELSKSKAARLKAYDNGVFKIVPLRAQRGAGSKKFTSIQEIVAEVQMLKLLDAIPGFARFRDVHVVQGRFPASYQEAWTRYSETRDDCYNPDPSKKKSYPDNQVWAILEMDNAGYELEKFDCSSIFQIYDIFWGVALGLARAEQFAAFEHRDLHLGNICIKSTKPKGCLHGPLKPSSQNPGIGTGFGLSGIETTIIDYSLSRANLKISDIPVDEDIAWSDLDKKKLFDAIGRDDDEKLLRDTYRLGIQRPNSMPSSRRTLALERVQPQDESNMALLYPYHAASQRQRSWYSSNAAEPLTALSVNATP
ncbi:hypothetical protein CISG_02475 [Coccidioides immitis RMSCC 3703]|uniref:Protein kinase domain-containing protein n=1 Tax=Coccidioides immitis RMSCC 3703 TaxID=454286 RepID=A0A0J8U349_COCIT|nr:hypothetical protein CISG_02475 [Coccidioides immitis RMSCC 3703]